MMKLRATLTVALLLSMTAQAKEGVCNKKVVKAREVCTEHVKANTIEAKTIDALTVRAQSVHTETSDIDGNVTVGGSAHIQGDLQADGAFINPSFQNLEGRVELLEDQAFGVPFAQASNDDDNVYPIELAQAPVYLSLITGLSRLAPELGSLRISNEAIQAEGGIWYRNDTDECWIAVNPTNPDNMIAVTHQDRWSGAPFIFGGIFLSDIICYTKDGGKTWNEADVTTSKCQGPTLPRSDSDFDSASDPYVTFDKHGNAYMIPLSFNILENFDEAICLFKSTDGGESWNKIHHITRDDGLENFQERPTLTADPYRNNVLYCVWPNELALVGAGDNIVNIQRSFDGGTTWKKPQQIMSRPVTEDNAPFPWGPILKVLPDCKHSLVVGVIFSPFPGEGSQASEFVVARSTDGGNTWSSNVIFEVDQPLVKDPENPEITVQSFNGGVDIALNDKINAPYGQLYAVFESVVPGLQPNQVGSVISTSLDGGVTWSTPVSIKPANDSYQEAFFPTIAIAQDGTVGVMYYDFRNHTSDSPSLETDVWLRTFKPDLTPKDPEVRITPVSFDMRQSIRRRGDFFVGDYQKLQANGNDFVACFTLTNPPYGIGISPLPEAGNFKIDDRKRQETLFARISRKPCKEKKRHK